MKTILVQTNHCKAMMHILLKSNYLGRVLYLVKTIGLETNREMFHLFYRSSGQATPDVCTKGEIRPILGIYDDRFSNMTNAIKSIWPKIDPVKHDGWIAKGGTKDPKDPNTWFGITFYRDMSKVIQNESLENVSDVDFYTFCTVANALYLDKEHFMPSLIYQNVMKRRAQNA